MAKCSEVLNILGASEVAGLDHSEKYTLDMPEIITVLTEI
jgi:hypothetical protein